MARALALLVATSAAAPVLAALYEYEDGASAFDWLHAILPKTKAETQAAAPKTKSAIGKQPLRKNSIQASIQRMAAAARERHEAREAREAVSGAGPSSAAADEADEVEVTGVRSRADRDAKLREQAENVD